MSKNACILHPEAPNGEPSRMYKDLLVRLKDRPLVNWLYAGYLVCGKTAMDNAGIAQNRQGQHNMQDYLDFIDFKKMQSEMTNLANAERQLGAVDINGQRLDFTNSEDALRKADDFNNNSKGLVANVVQHGDVYNIIVSEKNARTHTYGDTVKKYLQAWDIYKQAFNAIGVDITTMPQELQSVFNAMDVGLARYLKNLGNVSIANLYKKDAMILFSLSPNSPHVQRIVSAFGSIEDAAQALSDFNHGAGNLTVPQQRLMMRAINDAKTFQGMDLDALITQVDQTTQNLLSNSPEQDIKAELHRLNKKYHIGVEEIHRTSNRIDSLSDAAAEAAVNLKRQIRLLEQEKGNNTEGKRLEGILKNLMRELECKRYYFGVLKFLKEATTQAAEIDNLLQSIPQTGTELEKAFGTAKILYSVKALRDRYYTIVEALADEALIIDESISQADIDNIHQTALNLKKFFDNKKKVLNDLGESTMINLLTNIMNSDTAPNGQSIVNVVKMASVDSKMWEYLYSMGTASNPIIASAGSIVRNAQDSRDQKLNDIALRIRKATDKLYSAGFNSEYMYEDESHLISDIDWSSYKNARYNKIKALYAQGLRDFDLKQAVENWEDQNTEDRVVDNTNGRTERVPNSNYRKAEDFQEGWSQEEIEYYDTMMQIKGELGSLLPSYAQHQYLPPQIRREFLDAINSGDISKAFKNKVQDLYKVREDDVNFNTNGIIDGDEFKITEGAFDNTPLRQIPIFYINKVEEGELLKNFSTGLQALASTALNYEAMNNIVEVVEFMRDFVDNQSTRNINLQGDVVQDKTMRVVKDVWKRGKSTTTSALMEGFIAQHIYGQRVDPNEPKWLTKMFGNIISYGSFRALSTNFKGAMANYLMGEFQMLIEAGAGEFYRLKDYAWAHTRLFGKAGVVGDFMELLTNNMSHKSTLMRELFDPLQENYADKSRHKYYSSMFRQLVGHDCSFIGYSSGEYLIHYVNMYSLLHHEKVLLNGEKISLYDAFEVSDKEDGNAVLDLKQGVTDLDGNAITQDYIKTIKQRLRYLNQSTHGAMNAEDKGLIHQYWWGRGIMNFRQWMVGHYSRRFRGRHFDASLGMDREGYWVSLYKGLMNEDTKDTWKNHHKLQAIGMFMKDLYTFALRSEAQWHNLDAMQKYNIKRVRAEMLMFVILSGLSFALGEPDEHKKEFWRRWWIYQTRRALMDTEASMPHPKAFSNLLTILQSPMAAVNMMSSLLYVIYGITNGDIAETIKSGDHKGENKYLRNIIKYDLPFFKDFEQMQKMDTDEAVFKVFEDTPSNH